jgi:hypothetical protein
MPGGITLFALLAEEVSLCRQPEVADSSNALESQDGKTSIADSVPSTDRESDEEDSVQSNQEEGVEFPFVHMGGVVEDVKEVPVKEESKRGEKKTGIGNRWRVMKKSMKGSRLFPKRVKKKDKMKLKNNTEPKQDTHGPKPPPIVEAFKTPSTSNVVPAPPERASFWDQVKRASKGTMAAMDSVNESSMNQSNFAGSVESEAQYRKKNEGRALPKRWSNVMAENEDANAGEVDELISTIQTDFGDESIKQELEEQSAGCVNIALPSTTEMTLVSCVDKVDFMNSCGCRIDTVHEDRDPVLEEEAIATEANDDTTKSLKSDRSVHSGKGTGPEEDVSSESTKMDLSQDNAESEDSTITAPSVDEEADAGEVDELISTILTDFGDEGVKQELEEQSAGCVNIALPSTAEMTLVSCVDKIDFMNSCGCRIDTVHEEGDPVLDKEAIAIEANDDTTKSLKSDRSVHSGKGTGSEEDVSSESIKMDLPQDDTESEDSIITAPSVEEITMSTCTIDDESLASEYDDFKKAMVLLRNRAARQGLTEQHLLQKIRTEQQRRESLVDLASKTSETRN